MDKLNYKDLASKAISYANLTHISICEAIETIYPYLSFENHNVILEHVEDILTGYSEARVLH